MYILTCTLIILPYCKIISKNDNMDTSEEIQQIIKNAIEATTKGIFEFINKENKIVNKFFKSEIPNAILEHKISGNLWR